MADKLLYIGNDISDINCGADAVNKMNISCLQSVFHGNIKILPLIKNSIRDKLLSYIGGIDQHLEKNILSNLESGEYNYIFLSSSLMGRIAKKIKKKNPHVKIITFYHNIEIQYAKELIKTHGYKHCFFYINALFNESIACKYSDVRITLNTRDSTLLKQLYRVDATEILPVSYRDRFDFNKIIKSELEINSYLFVGTSFFANIEGIRWFVKNVMPKVNGKLIIVGSGMENYKEEFSSDMISVYGYVNDLADYYYRSSFVIAPIFVGGGMKTKIAEATMYGKTVLGTKEAFEGYAENPEVLVECTTPEEFILNISCISTKQLGYNAEARDYYLRNHSEKATLFKFQKIFQKIKML